MNLMKILATKSYCYKEMPNMSSVKGIMMHSTGINNPNLRRYVSPDNGLIGTPSSNNWNNYYINGSVHKVMTHAFIGKLKDGSVATVQVQEWEKKCYHCGTGTSGKSGNANYISFEICEDNLKDKNYFNAVYREAVELCAYLCEEYNLDPLKNIVCHSEAYAKGFASNHADIMHWFSKYGKTMNQFRLDVKSEMEGDNMTDEKFAQYMNTWIENQKNLPGSKGAVWDEAHKVAKSKGLIAGDENGRDMWKMFLTREQFILILHTAGLI